MVRYSQKLISAENIVVKKVDRAQHLQALQEGVQLNVVETVDKSAPKIPKSVHKDAISLVMEGLKSPEPKLNKVETVDKSVPRIDRNGSSVVINV